MIAALRPGTPVRTRSAIYAAGYLRGHLPDTGDT
jgi:hypothetical protein